MSGYSGPPVAKKLGIKPGTSLCLFKAPTGWRVPDLPDDVEISSSANSATITVAFFRRQAELEGQVDDLAGRVFPDRVLWIAWPRKAAGHETDMRDNSVRSAALSTGLVDILVAAIDEDWSGLKFMWRKELRS